MAINTSRAAGALQVCAHVGIVASADAEGDRLLWAERLLEEIVVVAVGGVLGLAEAELVRPVVVAELVVPDAPL